MNYKCFDMLSPISEDEFNMFYELIVSSFPKEERRSREGFLELIKTSPYYKIHTLFKGERLISLFTVWDFDDFRFGDHFAVSENERGGGIGGELLEKILKESSVPFILEVELPETQTARRRIGFYARHGFCENPYPYLLPPMQEGLSALPMEILSYPEALSKDEFDSIVSKLYSTVYNYKK